MTNFENKSIQKLISDLASDGIIFSLDQEETNIIGFAGDVIGRRKLENVIFTQGEKVHKVCFDVFFRCSGISCILETKKGEDNFVKLHPVTDAEFYEMEKQIILHCLKSLK